MEAPKNTSENTKTPSCPSTSSWAYVEFSATSLQNLKVLTTQASGPRSSLVSIDDILTAFIWKIVFRARLSRLKPETKWLGLPMTYPGLVVNMAYNTDSLKSLDREKLGVIASQLRRKLDPKTSDLAYNTCALATLLSRCPDNTKVPIPAPVDNSSGKLVGKGQPL